MHRRKYARQRRLRPRALAHQPEPEKQHKNYRARPSLSPGFGTAGSGCFCPEARDRAVDDGVTPAWTNRPFSRPIRLG